MVSAKKLTEIYKGWIRVDTRVCAVYKILNNGGPPTVSSKAALDSAAMAVAVAVATSSLATQQPHDDLNRPGFGGGSQPREGSESWQHRGSTAWPAHSDVVGPVSHDLWVRGREVTERIVPPTFASLR